MRKNRISPSQRVCSVSITMTSKLMLFREIICVDSENCKTHTHTNEVHAKMYISLNVTADGMYILPLGFRTLNDGICCYSLLTPNFKKCTLSVPDFSHLAWAFKFLKCSNLGMNHTNYKLDIIMCKLKINFEEWICLFLYEGVIIRCISLY